MSAHPLPKGWDYKPSPSEKRAMRTARFASGAADRMGFYAVEMEYLAAVSRDEDELDEILLVKQATSEYGAW